MKFKDSSSKNAKLLVAKLVGALIGGSLLGFSFLSDSTAYLVVFGLVIGLIVFMSASNIKPAALLGFLFGFSFFMIQSSWIISLKTFAGSWPYLGWVALSLIESMAYALLAVVVQVIHRKVKNIALAVVQISFVFVAIEIIRSMGPWAYSWGLVAIPLVGFKPISSIAVFTGWPGLSFIALFISTTIAFFIFLSLPVRQAGLDERRLRGRVLLIFLIVILFITLLFIKPSTDNHQQSTKVAILQTNVDMNEKWQQQKEEVIFKQLKALAAKADNNADLVIGPESAVPGTYPQNKVYLDRLRKIINSKLIIGSLRGDKGQIYNSAFFEQTYQDKNQLVLLGEYVPFMFLIDYIKPLRQSLIPGRSQKLLSDTAVLICSESADWLYARKLNNKGAQLIAAITNDGWFKGTSLPYQHLQLTRLRAIENGRYIVMAANYGYSAIIKSNGDIIEKSELDESQVLNGTVYKLKKHTFFSKYGHLTTWLILLVTCLITWYNLSLDSKNESQRN